MKKLYIIDGSGYLFRAYFALPEMEWPENMNVNAIFGFTKMMLKLLEEKPDYFVIAWDAPHKTLRHEMFEEYKANRPSIPDDFRQQIWKTKQLIKDIGIPTLELPGYEADDIIASVAQVAEKDEMIHTFVFSSDKDLKQMLSDSLTFKDPMKWIETNPRDFVNEYWFEPKLIVDYLAIVWDASDNIPGVRGIGKKWAETLIKTYWDLDNIYANIDKISGSTKQKLIDSKDIAYHSKKLIQLIDVPWINEASLDNYVVDLKYWLMEKELIEYYNFSSMKKIIAELKKLLQSPQMVSLFW